MDHKMLLAQVDALTKNVPHLIANLANISAAIWEQTEGINWAGFYILEKDVLVLSPFQGKPACIEIPVGKGVCGGAVAGGKTLVVPDVHQFPGHIACDSASNSEIVVPIRKAGKIWGVLDIDSPHFDRFSPEDAACFEQLVAILERNCLQ